MVFSRSQSESDDDPAYDLALQSQLHLGPQLILPSDVAREGLCTPIYLMFKTQPQGCHAL